MARFTYVAVDVDGRERRGALSAATEPAARAALAAKRLVPVRLAASAGAEVEAAPVGGRASPLRHKDRVLVTRQLATLIDASVPVEEAVGMAAAQQEAPGARRVLSDVQAGVQEGLRLADAMGRHPASFPALYRAAVGGGERAGKLGFVLTRLADHLAREHALRAKITAALIYPATLSVVATLVVSALMIFVVPSLTEQFQSFEAQLPLVTRILIGVSTVLTQFWPLILLGLAAAVVILRAAFARPSVRFGFDAWLLRAPVIGKQVRAVNASRFVRSVSTLAISGLPVLDGVRAAREAAGNRAVAKAIDAMADRIEEGEPLSQAMRASGVIPPLVVYMAASGENAGELPAMLERAADHLDQEFESFTQSALSLVEPAIIVVMGAIVAGIVLAIMLPILQLNQLAIG